MSNAPSAFHLLVAKALSLAVLIAPVGALSADMATSDQKSVFEYRFPLPLGADGFMVEPQHRPFYLLASAEDPGHQNLHVVRAHLSGTVTAADGRELLHYPDLTSFRVTATALDPTLLSSGFQRLSYDGDMNSLLLGIRFRLKVYQALRMKVMLPARVVEIGMPTDVPYDERVYRVYFNTAEIPVDARLVLEVLSPGGEPLSRFHLELL